jgi:uncharacterized membrane protein
MSLRGQHRLRGFLVGIKTWLYIIFAFGLGFIIPELDQKYFPNWISLVDKSTMTAILSAIASGMITLSGIVFSLVFVIVQFGSTSYSPRVTRLFAHSFVLNHALGVFTGTFIYSLMSLRAIGQEQTGRVSGMIIWVVFLWLLASVAVLARLVKVFTSLTITNIMFTLEKIGGKSIARAYGPRKMNLVVQTKRVSNLNSWQDNRLPVNRVVFEKESRYVLGYRFSEIADLAIRNNVSFYLPFAIGDSLQDGAPLVYVNGDWSGAQNSRILALIDLGHERSFYNDPKYSIRLLVDIAIRALSPAINDPTTAVQVLDHLELLLRRLGNSDLDIGEVRDTSGVLRLVYKMPCWDDYLQLALAEILQYGAGSIQVSRRLEALLLFLEQTVPPERAEVVKQFRIQRRLLVEEFFANDTNRQWAGIPDREGLGSAEFV